MSDIIKFLRLVVVFFVIVCASFFYIYSVQIPEMLESHSSGSLERWREFYKDTLNTDIIILGSSRARRHCNPVIISQKTNLKSQTIAVSGAQLGILETFYIDYKKNNKKPKLVIINIDYTGLANPLVLPFPYLFIPFAPSESQIWQMPEFERYKYFKALGIFDYRVKYTQSFFTPKPRLDSNGFVGSSVVWNGNSEYLKKTFPKGITYQMDSLSFIILDRLIKEIKSDNAEVVLIFSPEHAAIWPYETNKKEVVNKIKSIAINNKISLYDFSNSSYKLNYMDSLFFNTQHLNKYGALVFSSDLADSLIQNQKLFRK